MRDAIKITAYTKQTTRLSSHHIEQKNSGRTLQITRWQKFQNIKLLQNFKNVLLHKLKLQSSQTKIQENTSEDGSNTNLDQLHFLHWVSTWHIIMHFNNKI
jgi:ABC-type branched-subunit amino acid transport system ATPase component